MAKKGLVPGVKEGRKRVLIEAVLPSVDGGRYPIKRVVGESVDVEADVFADGHDVLHAVLRYREGKSKEWRESPMEPLVNDRWRGTFTVTDIGTFHYTIAAWVDTFQSWRRNLRKKVDAGLDVSVEIMAGVNLMKEAVERAAKADGVELAAWVREMELPGPQVKRVQLALNERIHVLMTRYPDRRFETVCDTEYPVTVDPVLARCGAWYELFPRSCSPNPGRHGTFKDLEKCLERISTMGFDILYLPPIHPVGQKFRKGRNNNPTSEPGEPGSVWAIGGPEGGHKSVHPELGTLNDFRNLVAKARAMKLEIALDIAFQCSPDHPYITEGRNWFRKRSDGSIQYAENPPKKYQDIYPFDFEVEDWRGLWEELKSIFDFWIKQGVTIFRVDNPHTKAFAFWEWAIPRIKARNPEVLFLSEAFTRPKLLYRLAKLGFSQSYNYFPWRNTKAELTEYFTELTQTDVKEFCRPNLWPNTPDILTEYLQEGGRPAFMTRFILAATLGASYGIYGPAFELCVNEPREKGGEEYLYSEKYEIKHWNLEAPDNLSGYITIVNRARRENPALQSNERLHFHTTDNEELLAYSKRSESGGNVVLVIVNLHSKLAHSGWTNLTLEELGLDEETPFEVHDLLSGARYLWKGPRNFVQLNPKNHPAHLFRVEPKPVPTARMQTKTEPHAQKT